MMCLGAGISDVMPQYGKEIHTTVNNTALKGEILVLDNSGNVLENISKQKDFFVEQEPLFVRQDDVLYGILPEKGQRVNVCGENRQTHWYDLNKLNRETKDTVVPVFELAIYHGVHPIERSYTYFMYWGDHDAKQYLQKEQLQVLANNNKVQAVSSAKRDIIQAIFYDTDAILEIGDCKLKLSIPGAVMLERSETEQATYITVCDGVQDPSRKEMTVWVKHQEKEWKEIHIKLPDGSYCGMPVTVKYTELV